MRAKIINVFGKAKITNLVHSIADEYIGRFEVAMDDFLSDQLGEAAQNLPHDFESLLLFNSFAFDGFLEVAVLAELGDDVETVF